MIQRLFVLTVFLPAIAFATEGEPCPLVEHSEQSYWSYRCQFYLGTTAFRAEAFEVAAVHWGYILETTDESEFAVAYRAQALSALAFARFHGFGVEKNVEQAISDWKVAARQGSLESRLQLGRTYSDSEYTDFDPVIGLAWYQSVELAFEKIEEPSESDRSIYEGALEDQAPLTESLSAAERAQALGLARALME